MFMQFSSGNGRDAGMIFFASVSNPYLRVNKQLVAASRRLRLN